MRAILIDPKDLTISEVETEHELGALQNLVGGYLEIAGVVQTDFPSPHILLVDEEGRMKKGGGEFAAPIVGRGVVPIVGRGIVLGAASRASGGDFGPATCSVDDIEQVVWFSLEDSGPGWLS